MIETFGIFRLVCDECGKPSDQGSLEQIQDGWYLDQFWYAPGYAFFRISCSEECRHQAKERFTEKYLLAHIVEVPIETVKPIMVKALNTSPLPWGPPPDDNRHLWHRTDYNG